VAYSADKHDKLRKAMAAGARLEAPTAWLKDAQEQEAEAKEAVAKYELPEKTARCKSTSQLSLRVSHGPVLTDGV
jgi:hypothetical protein